MTQAPAGAGGIRQWLSTLVVSAVALVLTLVVISLSVGSSLPGASLRAHLTTGAYGGSKNDTSTDFLLSRGVFQGDQEPLPSSEASLDTREVNSRMPEPVVTGDTDTTAKLDEGTTLDLWKSSTDFQRAVRVEVLVYSPGFLHNILQTGTNILVTILY
jgi:hypothetical protein